MFFRSCGSCNRPPLPDVLITLALIFVGAVALLMAYFVFSTLLAP